MKRRILAAALGAVVALGAAAPALAADDGIMPISLDGEAAPISDRAETSDAALARVTAVVKGTLDIGDEYTEFSGSSYNEGPITYWSLYWSDDDRSISVTADANGKVLRYNYSEFFESYEWTGSYSPAFPATSRQEAQETAEAFCEKVLGENESVVWGENEGTKSLGVTNHYIRGMLAINGVETEQYVSVSVRAADGMIIRFSRSDSGSLILPEIPSPDAIADKSAASDALKGAYELELRYVLDDDGVPVLRYVLKDSDELLVDAKTGEVIDVAALMEGLERGSDSTFLQTSGAEAAYDLANTKLSEVELSAVAKYEGAMSIDELEVLARGIDGLGLGDEFKLSSSSYSVASYKQDEEADEDERITATLRFVRDRTDGEEVYRTSKSITLDAKTGEFVSSSGYTGEETTLDAQTLQKNAEAFAAAHAEHFDSYKLYDSDETNYVYCRFENGVPFVDDAVRLTLDGSDGTIIGFWASYTEGLEFESPEGVISAEEALDAYFGAYSVELRYAALPVAVHPTDLEPLKAEYANAGYDFVYEYRLVYSPVPESMTLGVDAKTGELVRYTVTKASAITYSDANLSYAAEIASTLGEYGVGYEGGTLAPTASLTQLDMLRLLLSASGVRYEAELTDEQIEDIYRIAKSYGLVVEKQNPQAVVTRAELIKTLIGATEYGKAAALENIWTPGFTDDAAISSGDAGYVAIAKALGIVRGDGSGAFNPNAAMSRQDALIVVYNYLAR